MPLEGRPKICLVHSWSSVWQIGKPATTNSGTSTSPHRPKLGDGVRSRAPFSKLVRYYNTYSRYAPPLFIHPRQFRQAQRCTDLNHLRVNGGEIKEPELRRHAKLTG